MKFGEKLAKLRAEKSLKQSEVAEAVGISRRNYISYETEGRYPRNREIYYKLAGVFGCDVNYLLTEDEEFIARAGEEYGEGGYKDAEKLVSQLIGLFAGGELSEEDRDAVMRALTEAYFECKAENKKYAPKKSRKSKNEEGDGG